MSKPPIPTNHTTHDTTTLLLCSYPPSSYTLHALGRSTRSETVASLAPVALHITSMYPCTIRLALLLSLLLAPCTVPPSSQSPSHRGSEQPLWDNLRTTPPSSQVSAGTSPYTPLFQPRTATTKQTSSCEKWDYSSTAHQHPQAHTSQVQFSPCRSYKVPPTTHPCTFPVPESPSPPTSPTALPLYQHPCYNTAGL